MLRQVAEMEFIVEHNDFVTTGCLDRRLVDRIEDILGKGGKS